MLGFNAIAEYPISAIATYVAAAVFATETPDTAAIGVWCDNINASAAITEQADAATINVWCDTYSFAPSITESKDNCSAVGGSLADDHINGALSSTGRIDVISVTTLGSIIADGSTPGVNGGGGGGGAGNMQPGFQASGNLGGAGGYQGGGRGGDCYQTQGTGGNGTQAGGGGAGGFSTSDPAAGGDGADGKVIITCGTTVTTYLVPGTYTWTAPSDATSATVECWGGGAGGHGCAAGTVDEPKWGSGGAGAMYSRSFLAIEPDSTHTVIVGAGGAGGIAGDNPGGSGGYSSFDLLVKAVGPNGINGTMEGGIGDIKFSGAGGGGSSATPGGGGGGSGGTSPTPSPSQPPIGEFKDVLTAYAYEQVNTCYVTDTADGCAAKMWPLEANNFKVSIGGEVKAPQAIWYNDGVEIKPLKFFVNLNGEVKQI